MLTAQIREAENVNSSNKGGSRKLTAQTRGTENVNSSNKGDRECKQLKQGGQRMLLRQLKQLRQQNVKTQMREAAEC